MQERWLKIGDDWFTRVVTPDSLSIKKNHFIQARALKPRVEVSGVTAADTREGIDGRQFVSFTGLFRTTEQGAWSAWTELRRKGDRDLYSFVYNCELNHKENRWTVAAAGAIGPWADRVLIRPAATDLPQ